MQSPTFSSGITLSTRQFLSLLGMVEILFDGELLEKEKMGAVSFLLNDRAFFWWTRIKTNREETNKGLVV